MHLRNSFNQHNKVRRPGESHRGAGRKKKARSSHIVVLIERITQMHALYPSLRVQKWSTDQARSKSCQKDKGSRTEKQTNKQKTQSQKRNGQDSSRRPPQPVWRIGSAHEKQQQTRSQSKILQRCPAKQKPAAPKPRILPARIPEIALRSHPGMRHLHKVNRHAMN